jgi:HEAT repeat protein
LAASIAKRRTGGLKLLTTLSKDKNSSVRSFVASSLPNKNRLPLYLKLTADPDWEVRRLAVKSLGMVNDPKSITALLNAMSDESDPVRKAAEDSLIELKLSDAVLQKIVDDYLQSTKSQPSAITILGQLKFTPAAPFITKILSESNNDDVILRSVKALGLLQYDKARKEVDTCAVSTNVAVRTAVAKTLGVFAKEKSFNTLLTLSNDKNTEVASEAIKAMGVTKSSFFKQRLLHAMKQVNSDSTIRSNACWSEARTGEPSASAITQLKRLSLDQVIPAMGMMEYDTDFVRISATLALIDLGKNCPKAKKTALEIVKTLKQESTNQFEAQIAGDTLKEFARQAELYMNGRKNISKTPFPTTKPSLTAQRIK